MIITKRLAYLLTLGILTATSLFAQRTADFRRLSLENGNPSQKSWFISDQSSLGIDASGTLTGTFPNTNAMLTIGAGTKGNALDLQSMLGGTGILFSQNQPATGIDMSLGASGTGIVVDGGTPLGMSIGLASAGGDGITVDATNSGISIGNGTAPNNGMNIEASSTGLAIGTLTTPDMGQTTFGNVIGGTFDAGVIGVDIGQNNSPTLGLGVRSNGTGIDVNEGGFFGTGINVTMNNFIGTGINIQDNSFIGTGLNINSLNAIQTSGSQTFGDGGGSDNTTLNLGGGDLTLNGIAAPALPGPLSNLLYLNGSSQVRQTPGGVNIVTGSGTTNTIPLWTPDGFKIGDSYLSQSTNVAGGTLTSSESTIINSTVTGNMLTVNNFDAASTALKINANGGVGIDVDPASTGIIVDATVTGIDFQGSDPSNAALTMSRNSTTIPLFSSVSMGGIGAITTGHLVSVGGVSSIGRGYSVTADGVSAMSTGVNVSVDGISTMSTGVNVLADGISDITTGLNIQVNSISNLGTGINLNNNGIGTFSTGINISSANTALITSRGAVRLGSGGATAVAAGGAIPATAITVVVGSDGAATAATATLPAVSEGQIIYITTSDPDGVAITVGLNVVVVDDSEVGVFMCIGGQWRLAH